MKKSLILIWVSQIYGLSQEGFQALVLVAEVLLDLRPRLAFGRICTSRQDRVELQSANGRV